MKYFIVLIQMLGSGITCIAQQPVSDSGRKRNTVALDSVTVFNNGYQAITKDRATGSFTHVDNATLNLQVGTNVLNRLESVTSSIAFSKKGSSIPAISVRGLSTINGPTAPLIILDNFPYEGDINAINPNLIESITVLKDATAASIWGTRAGNGVIVINTKKGRYSQPLTIDFSSSAQITGKPVLSKIGTISSGDYIDVERLLFSKGYYNNQLTSPSRPTVSSVVDILDRQFRGLMTLTEANAQIDALRNNDIKDVLSDKYHTNALAQQYAISFSGGSSRMSWLAGGGYDNSQSVLMEKTERKTLRIETSFTALKNLKFTTSIYAVATHNKTGKDDYANQDYLCPYSDLYTATGKPSAFGRQYRLAYTDTLGSGKLLDWNYYPAEDYLHRYAITKTTNLIINLGAQYVLGHGFSLDAKFQSERQHGQRKLLSDAQSYAARFLVNQYSQINPTNGAVTYIVPQGGILDINNSDIGAENYRVQLNYNRNWTKHRVTALVGNETRQIHNTDESYRTYGYDENVGIGTITDLKNRYPTITTGELLTIPIGENTFTDQLKRYVSWFGNASYNYDNKYSINVSARRDASNLFGITTNQKWTPLWSVGGGWDISNAAFYRSSLFPRLKIRATYGYTGNADPLRSGVVTVFVFGNSANTGLAGYRIRQFPNPHLRWEQVAISNFGIDFSVKNNRVSGSVEYYSKKGIDLFANSPVDQTAGIAATGIVKNVANMKGRGIDVVINSINTFRKLRWTTGLIFNYNTDYVTESFFNSSPIFFVGDGGGISALKGKPVHSVWSLPWAGLDPATGNPQGLLKGKVSTDYSVLTSTTGVTLDDLEYNGTAMPQFFGSLTNEFAWKSFSLNINIGYKFKYFFKRKPLNYSVLFLNDKKSTADFALRWQKPGDEVFTDIPSLTYPLAANRDNFYTQSSAIVEKGDHIRLQFVNLSYKLNFKKNKLQQTSWKMQFFITGSNLGILWRANKHDLDPDYAVSAVPPSKTFAVGIKLFFQ